MSNSFKNRLEVQKIIRDVLSAGIEAMSLGEWDIMEFGNASFQRADKIILMNLLRSTRVGWQSTSYGDIDGVFSRTENICEEQSWQIHTICKRKNDTTLDDILAEDVATKLILWLNGETGMAMLRQRGVAPLRIDAESILVYNDNSDLYQKRAVFTVKIQVPKEMSFGEIQAEAIKPDVKPI